MSFEQVATSDGALLATVSTGHHSQPAIDIGSGSLADVLERKR
jgi:hypothetical protein